MSRTFVASIVVSVCLVLPGWAGAQSPDGAFCQYLARVDARIGNGANIEGPLGANDPGGFVRLGRKTEVQSDVTITAATVAVGNGSSVALVATDVLLAPKADVGIPSDPTLPIQDPFCPVPAFECGGPDVVVERRGTADPLPPGTYGDVVVHDGGTLTLVGGAYRFCSFLAGRNGTIDVGGAGRSTIDVAGPLRIENGSVLGPVGGALEPFINVGGSAARIGAEATIAAFLSAPEARLRIGRATRFTGAFCADRVVAGRNVILDCAAPPPSTTTSTVPSTSTTTTTSSTSSSTTTTTSSTVTTTTTTAAPVCGNRAVEAGEECDDGNTDPGDGCTNVCTACGNDVITAPESCDDGNTDVNDNCPEDCRMETCSPTGAFVQTVTITASRSDLSSIRFLLDYPDGRVALGGGAGPDVPAGTLVDTPDGADGTAFDLEHAIRLLVGAPFAFETAAIARVNLLGCEGQTLPDPSDYRCLVIDAADGNFVNVPGVTCTVSVGGAPSTTTTTTTSTTATTTSTVPTTTTVTSTTVPSTTSSTTTTLVPATTSTTSTSSSTTTSTTTSTTSTTSTTLPAGVLCSANGLNVTVSIAYPESILGGISAILLNVSYVPPVSIPGSGNVLSVRQRITSVAGAGSQMSPNDRDTNGDTVDDRLDVQARASTTGSLDPAPVFRARFDCSANTSVSPSAFGCTQSQSTALDGLPFPPELASQISCAVSLSPAP